MELLTHYIDREQAVGCVGPVVIRVVGSARTEVDDVDRIVALVDDVLTRAPAAGMWIVVHHGAPIPDGAMRKYMGRVFEPYTARLSSAYSMLGLGFWASAASAATRVLTGLMGANSPITTTVEAGAERLCLDLVGVDPARLVAGHEQLLRQMTESGSGG